MHSPNLQLRHNSAITTQARGTGNGGNIDIETDLLIALENSQIIANAFQGRGGNIRIATQGLFRSPDSKITASSQLGVDGIVDIQSPNVDPSKGLVILPQKVVDVTGLVAQGCWASRNQASSSQFIITGRGGLPPNPSGILSSETVLADLGSVMVQTASKEFGSAISTHPTSPSPTRIVEAQGWVVADNGQVFLTASAPAATSYSPMLASAKCSPR